MGFGLRANDTNLVRAYFSAALGFIGNDVHCSTRATLVGLCRTCAPAVVFQYGGAGGINIQCCYFVVLLVYGRGVLETAVC